MPMEAHSLSQLAHGLVTEDMAKSLVGIAVGAGVAVGTGVAVGCSVGATDMVGSSEAVGTNVGMPATRTSSIAMSLR